MIIYFCLTILEEMSVEYHNLYLCLWLRKICNLHYFKSLYLNYFFGGLGAVGVTSFQVKEKAECSQSSEVQKLNEQPKVRGCRANPNR
jgi:hypothetical protein